jgi:hypothetical protein
MNLTREAADAIEAARLEGRITEGSRVRLPEAYPEREHETEKEFMARVVKLAKERGFKVYHTLNSRGCTAGFPDVVLARRGSPLLIIELKTETGKLPPAQAEWIAVLLSAGVDARVWRPSSWPEIERTLA